MRACPKCGAPALADESFCGVDGTPIATTFTPPGTRVPPSTCPNCGGRWQTSEDVCIACGHRLRANHSSAPPSSVPVSNVPLERELSVEEDERCGLASSLHAGLHREHNEDAVSFACGKTPRGDAFRVLVVCDGVSTSTHAEQASEIGARVIRDVLAEFCTRRDAGVDTWRRVMADAIASAHEAICAHAREHRSPQPPGTTCVAALIVRDRLIVGWVGDSRAYWLNDRRVDLLTRDHSWVNEAVANGEATLQEAMRSPYAHALTRCLGPLEPGEPIHPVRPDVITRTLTGPGLIVLCSDGLWNYYPIPEQMGALVQRCGPSPTVSRVARFLVHKALSRGGQDNIAVAVYGHTRPGSAA